MVSESIRRLLPPRLFLKVRTDDSDFGPLRRSALAARLRARGQNRKTHVAESSSDHIIKVRPFDLFWKHNPTEIGKTQFLGVLLPSENMNHRLNF